MLRPLNIALRHPAGFTLLEVLMVVLVVGILSSIVLLNINLGGPERRMADETERLASVLSLAAEEAVMQNREYGLLLEEQAYHFLCFDEKKQKWRGCTETPFLSHDLPEGLELRLMSGQKLRLPQKKAKQQLTLNPEKISAINAEGGETLKDDMTAPVLEPDVLLLSSGEGIAVELQIRVRENPLQHTVIRLDEIGRVSVGDKASPSGEASAP
ncbi:MAG: type II secretion system minor pseudopilin GspH [Moraxellaceae bacterium]|nr:type II secretion system minor pseudopilin GspH [Moraxellaceae bacterium]